MSKICPGPVPAGGRRKHLVGQEPSARAHVPPRGVPCRWQFVLWVKRGETRSVMTGWEGLVELHLLFPPCWHHQISRAAPHSGSQRSRSWNSISGNRQESPVSAISSLFFVSRNLPGVFSSCPYRQTRWLPFLLGKKHLWILNSPKAISLQTHSYNLHFLLLSANLKVISSQEA